MRDLDAAEYAMLRAINECPPGRVVNAEFAFDNGQMSDGDRVILAAWARIRQSATRRMFELLEQGNAPEKVSQQAGIENEHF